MLSDKFRYETTKSYYLHVTLFAKQSFCLSTNCFRIMGRYPKSAVWKYFEKDGLSSKCTIEGSTAIVNSHQVTNLKDYLFRNHRAIYDEVQAEDAKFKKKPVSESPLNQLKLTFKPELNKMSKSR